jgi:DNA (cytosine-5)-methyltransferase 1
VAESRWAVEVFEPAADAYKLNNPACTVFKDCCNMLLKNAIDGIPVNAKGQKIPRRGEVIYHEQAR